MQDDPPELTFQVKEAAAPSHWQFATVPGQVGVSGWQERLKSASDGVQRTLTVRIILLNISTLASQFLMSTLSATPQDNYY